MTFAAAVRAYAAAALALLLLDLLWLGVLAADFYQQQLAALLRPEVSWAPAALFYALYISALLLFVVAPAHARAEPVQALVRGAFFGLVAYATYDLTSLALIRDFPLEVALVDLVWGSVLSAAASLAGYAAAGPGNGRRAGTPEDRRPAE